MNVILSNFHKQGFGQTAYVELLGRMLAQRGHDVTVACPRGSWLADRSAAAGLRVEDGFRFAPGLAPVAVSRDLLLARRLIRDRQPDVVHVNGSQDHWVMATARSLFGLPPAIVRTKHNSFPVRVHGLNRLLANRLTHGWIVVSEAVRQDLLGGSLFREPIVETIHNGLDISKYQPGKDQVDRARFGLRPDDFVIGCLGRITAAKGHRYLLDAVAPLMKQPGSNLRLLLVGWGEEMPALEKQAEQLGIARFVTFGGLHDDVAPIISMFDVGVLASIDCESSSFALKEIMAMGVPCVCTDFAGNAEIVQHERNGFVVPPADPVALRERIEQLWRSPTLCRRFGEASREHIRQHFSVATWLDRTLEAYHKALRRAHPAAS